MNLHETMRQIGSDFGLDAEKLIMYADQINSIGGYHPNPHLQKFESGAIWEVEGRIIYALMCLQEPLSVLELGSFSGCSGEYMKSAIQWTGFGEYVCVSTDSAHGAINEDAAMYLKKNTTRYDFIFEDTTHTADNLCAIWTAAAKRMKPGAFIVSHDAMHFREGEHVRAGIERAGFDAKYYLTKPSDCGLAIWRKPAKAVEVSTAKKARKKPVKKAVSRTKKTDIQARQEAVIAKQIKRMEPTE